jgi:hypothetical protein
LTQAALTDAPCFLSAANFTLTPKPQLSIY